MNSLKWLQQAMLKKVYSPCSGPSALVKKKKIKIKEQRMQNFFEKQWAF